MSRIFAKTAKGKTEIQTRENRLAPRVRQILICVDSKKTLDDIKNMDLFPEQELNYVIEMLVAEGYIEVSLESEAQAELLRQQKEAAQRELYEQSEQARLDREAAAKLEREESKQHEAALKAALKKEKEEERRREREMVSGWSNTQMNKDRY